MLFRSVSQSRYGDWTKDKANETRWNIKSLQKGIDKLTEEINGMKLDNELKKRTIDNKVKESSLTLQNLMSDKPLPTNRTLTDNNPNASCTCVATASDESLASTTPSVDIGYGFNMSIPGEPAPPIPKRPPTIF